ncbi:hypothetical protein LNAOJCKE_3000 [Methylorubrum aminovorans]|uniref:Uncharacterized protein n=1 Tax=Methylorubrum aminovorans TaxID=269069 RepID=A0ABQ4UG46_9HYPH|nr:hypothetical protein LNAOJCKE_3000 [Methylorubrum aminovorans]
MPRLVALLVLAGVAAAAVGRRPARPSPAFVFPLSRTVH